MADVTPTNQQLADASRIVAAHAGKGWLPPVLFDAIASTVVTPTVELVLVAQTKDGLGVILTKRDQNERFWPGAWHVPGKIVVTTDSVDDTGSFQGVLERLIANELGSAHFLVEPQLLNVVFGKNERGAEVRVRYWGLVSEVTAIGSIFTLDTLPDQFLSEQLPMITAALGAAHHYSNAKNIYETG